MACEAGEGGYENQPKVCQLENRLQLVIGICLCLSGSTERTTPADSVSVRVIMGACSSMVKSKAASITDLYLVRNQQTNHMRE